MRSISRARVLLVGHETALKRGLRSLLASCGYGVDGAASGYGALAALEREQIGRASCRERV